MCINRNILECKSIRQVQKVSRKLVLIETYWNVNSLVVFLCPFSTCVLIETYWNVNKNSESYQVLELLY